MRRNHPSAPSLVPRSASRAERRRVLRPLERALRLGGWAALAWVSWGWLDARLYQAQQERIFAERVGVGRLERLAETRAGGPAAPEARQPRTAGVLVPTGDDPQQPASAPPPAAAPPPQPPAPVRPPATRASERPTSVRPPPAASEVVDALALGQLTVERLGMKVMVAPDVDARSLRRAAGHIPGTARPGSDGNVGLAGHRDTFFRPLRRIETGDEIVLSTASGTARYTVEWTDVVSPHHVDVLAPTPYPALTLVTCYPFYFVGNAPDRFIVRARLVERLPG